MTGSRCSSVRQALGVYVVGAIAPAERAEVDAHLAGCTECRDELASLAGLPALLARVPVADAERFAQVGHSIPAAVDPPPELLTALIGRVAARRRARRHRAFIAAAAAAIVAIGGTVGVSQAVSSHAPPVRDVATATNRQTQVQAVVAYSRTSHGITMQVQVKGIPAGTQCKFWVVGTDGRRWIAGQWTVGVGYGQQRYPASSSLAMGSVRSFVITASGQTLIAIPAR
jgi:anti-sigma factor RsiW